MCSGGCLKRTISVTTDPPGALVWINDVEVGRTPLETDFTYYGDYDVRLRREGYEPIVTHANADTPVQELPGIDLVSEVLPVRLHNVVQWHWDLVPVVESAPGKESAEAGVIARANDLRAMVPVDPNAPVVPKKAKDSKESKPAAAKTDSGPAKANEPAATTDTSAPK
jgi:hypothetical protein